MVTTNLKVKLKLSLSFGNSTKGYACVCVCVCLDAVVHTNCQVTRTPSKNIVFKKFKTKLSLRNLICLFDLITFCLPTMTLCPR